jgi:hypothetical protein
MPDAILLLKALGAAAAIAAILGALPRLLGGLRRRSLNPVPVAAGGVLGVGFGFVVGCGVLGQWPHWPPSGDRDRLLAVVWLAVIAVELAAVFPRVPRWLVWLGRLALAGGAARVLLDGTTYLTDLIGPGSREWSPAQAGLILGGLGAALAAVWALLVLLAQRTPGRSTPSALALTCAGAGMTIMLSGYTTGGQVGLVLAGALAGATLASLAVAGPPQFAGVLGLGVVGLFSLLVIGRFLGQLTTAHAVLLFAAPLLCWLPEPPYSRRLRPWLLGLARVALVAIPVVTVGVQAQQKFLADSGTTPGKADAPEPSIQDYMDFGR